MSAKLSHRLAYKLRPEIATMPHSERAGALNQIITLIWSIPLALIGLVWLLLVTDFERISGEAITLFILLIVTFLLQRYAFRLQVQLRKGMSAATTGSLEAIVVWSAALIFGPSALWLGVFGDVMLFIQRWRQDSSPTWRWFHLSNLTSSLTGSTLAGLIGLSVYSWLGGVHPIEGLTGTNLIPGIMASLTVWLVLVLISSIVMFFKLRNPKISTADSKSERPSLLRAFALNIGVSAPIYPFAILPAGLYALGGVGVYLFFMIGVLLFSVLARGLSEALKRNEIHTRELQELEAFSKAILALPPDQTVAGLPGLLAEYGQRILPESDIHIWLTPDQVLLNTVVDKRPLPQLDRIKAEVEQGDAEEYTYDQIISLDKDNNAQPRQGAAVPIQALDGTKLGGIYVLQQHNADDVSVILPAMQSIASQVALAQNREEIFQQTLVSERMTKELEVAGQIQKTFLPNYIPEAPSWEIAATIVPARETSGDFYDFIPLEDGRLGILIADVADKGTGAALYMALSRTLIRTFAMQNPDHPEEALRLANERIIMDTQSEQFVTLYYGVLDLENGRLLYSNAGHNPTYLFHADGSAPMTMPHNGIPLGMFSDMSWERKAYQLIPGDILMLYTDGVPEAQNLAKEEFGEWRMEAVAAKNLHASAEAMQNAMVTAVAEFVGSAHQFDDITMLVVRRVSS